MAEPLVGIIMGSSSDWETMRHAADTLEQLGVAHETKIVSAHRTPKRLYDYAHSARDRGLKVVIAGAGGAAHLPGMTASMTSLPVLGVPVESQALKGMDSLLSIVQMPAGVPVGTLAIGKAGAVNAALLAAAMLATNDDALAARLDPSRWPMPSVMRLFGALGGMDDEELRATFNGGLGMVVVLPPAAVAAAIEVFDSYGIPSSIVGEVVEAAGRDGERYVEGPLGDAA